MALRKKTAAIVPTYNRRKLFERAVQSVLDQNTKPEYFLILDNGCNDTTTEYLSALVKARTESEQPRVIVYRQEQNLGASGGMRFLFDRALELDIDWIWVMDDDGFAEPDALKGLLETPVMADPDTYILEAAIVNEKGEWSPENRPAKFDAASFSFTGLSESVINSAEPVLVHTGPYCGMMIRREAFKEFGFPHDDFYLWYDDVEFVLRVSLTKKAYLVPNARIQHFAQALVPHVIKWPFRAPLPEVPIHLAWRYYYLNRNWLWMAKQWLPKHRFALFWSKHMLRHLAGPVLLGQDQLPLRWKLAMQAGLDAVLGRLGKRITPQIK